MNKREAVRYTSQDVVRNGEDAALKVTVGGVELLLPALTVGDEVIFIFNPNDEHARRAGEAALTELAGGLVENDETKVYRFLTPESSKSVLMVQNVAKGLSADTNNEIRLDTEMFLKGKSREELAGRLGEDAYILDYSPITKSSNFIGISQEKAAMLQEEMSAGVQFLFLDDVVSTGSTTKAIQRLLSEFLSQDANSLPILAVAREVKPDFDLQSDPDNWLYSIVIPILQAEDLAE